jgi:hypothetical protein
VIERMDREDVRRARSAIRDHRVSAELRSRRRLRHSGFGVRKFFRKLVHDTTSAPFTGIRPGYLVKTNAEICYDGLRDGVRSDSEDGFSLPVLASSQHYGGSARAAVLLDRGKPLPTGKGNDCFWVVLRENPD